VQTHPIRWQRLGTIGLATWFVALSVMRLTVIWPDRAIDMRLYLRGTSEWLNGGDPWSVHFGTMHFAAAPTAKCAADNAMNGNDLQRTPGKV